MLENPSVGFRLEFHREELSCYRQGASKPQSATFLTQGDIPPPPPPTNRCPRCWGNRTKEGEKPFCVVPSLPPRSHGALLPKPASQFRLGSTPIQEEPGVIDRVLRHKRF